MVYQPTPWETVGLSLCGSGALLGLALFLGKTWVETRIKEDVQYEYKKRFESYKAEEKRKSEKEDSLSEIDKRLFETLMKELPGDSECFDKIKMNSFGKMIERSKIDILWRFAETWNDVYHEFHDKEVEEAKNALIESINEFYKSYALNTFVHDKYPECQFVPDELRRKDHKRYYDILRELDDKAYCIIQQYELLIRCGRKKFSL